MKYFFITFFIVTSMKAGWSQSNSDKITEVMMDSNLTSEQQMEKLRELIPKPTEAEIKNLKYPTSPTEETFKKIVKENLKDPSSAQFKNITKPKKSWLSNSKVVPIYIMCGLVNAKNGFGGYSGFSPYAVIVSPTFKKAKMLDDGDVLEGYVYFEHPNPCLK